MNQEDGRLDDFFVLVRQRYRWAIDIVRRHFEAGIQALCDEAFFKERYARADQTRDPIYAELLRGMEDEPLAKTFVSYWNIGHTIATQSRFWLESSIVQIILYQKEKFGRPVKEVYSQDALSKGFPGVRCPVAFMGETVTEHRASMKPWKVPLKDSARKAVAVLVDRQEGERPDFAVGRRGRADRSGERAEAARQAVARDMAHLSAISDALTGVAATDTNIHCNLLVIEPHGLDKKPHVWAIRLVNPKVIARHADRKQERINLLRLYALLVQEKIMREPRSIEVREAELLPRASRNDDRHIYPDYFSAATFWSSDQLWEYIGVPFDVVTIGLRDAAKVFRDMLRQNLTDLLPQEKEA